MTNSARYDAFLTYSHTDAREANRIHAFLEQYALPGKRRLKVYLDRTDIRSGGLADEITDALQNAGALVVCCSNAAARSEWVGREIAAFREAHPEHAVHPVLLEGDPTDAIPAALRDQELRFTDLRAGWRAGVLRPGARVELVRLLAPIAGVELRTLIPWDRRRRVRRLATAGGAVSLVVAIGMAIPVSTWTRVPTITPVAVTRHTIDAAETQGRELVIVTRMPASSERGYVQIWRGEPGPEGDQEWLERNFNPHSRLLPVHFAHPDLLARAEMISRAANAIGIQSGDSVWIGEPRPDHFIAVHLHPPPDDYTPLAGEALVGSSDVWTAAPGESVRHAVVEGLYPELRNFIDARHFEVSSGIPVGWGSSGIWIGAPTHTSYSSSGGLWHSSDGGNSFSEIPGFRSVHSILVDEPERGKVLVAEVLRPVPPNVIIPILPPERSHIALGPADGEWSDFAGPPHGDTDVLELVGRLEDGPLVVRVGQDLFARGRTPFVNWLRVRR